VYDGATCVPIEEDSPEPPPDPVIQAELQQGITRVFDAGMVVARQPNGDVDVYTPDGCNVGRAEEDVMSLVHFAERYIVQRSDGCSAYRFDLWSLGYPACQLQLNMYGPNGEEWIYQFDRQVDDETCRQSILLEPKEGIQWSPPVHISEVTEEWVVNEVFNVVDISQSLGENARNLFRNPSCLMADINLGSTATGVQAQFTPAPGCGV
jgi:hypothetical protein